TPVEIGHLEEHEVLRPALAGGEAHAAQPRAEDDDRDPGRGQAGELDEFAPVQVSRDVQCTSDSEYTGPPALDSVAPAIRFAPARVPVETVRPGARTPGRGARSRWRIAVRRSLAIQFQPRGVPS